MCQAYRRQHGFDAISIMPTNLYGPGDNYDVMNSHVLPALIRRIHEAKLASAPSITIWGTGTPLREFLHVDDLASAALYLMKNYSGEQILNVGSGVELTIMQLAVLIADVVGYEGDILLDPSQPDGTPRKGLDVTKLTNLGWVARIELRAGVAATGAVLRDRSYAGAVAAGAVRGDR